MRIPAFLKRWLEAVGIRRPRPASDNGQERSATGNEPDRGPLCWTQARFDAWKLHLALDGDPYDTEAVGWGAVGPRTVSYEVGDIDTLDTTDLQALEAFCFPDRVPNRDHITLHRAGTDPVQNGLPEGHNVIRIDGV